MTADAEFFGSGKCIRWRFAFVGDALWLANRAQGRFYEINGKGQFDVDAEEINGVSVLPDGNLSLPMETLTDCLKCMSLSQEMRQAKHSKQV